MRYAKFLYRYCFVIAIISIGLFVLCGNYVSKLKVRSNFKEMLPSNAPSVVELNRIESRVRSTDNLIVLIGAPTWPELKTFIDNFIAKLKTDLGDDVSKVEYNVDTVKNYYDHNKYLYIDLDDLKEIYDRLKRRIDWEKVKQTPLFLQISEEEPVFETKDIEDKYSDKTGRYQNYQDGYLTSNKAEIAAIMIWPSRPATDVEFSKAMIERIENVIKTTPGYGPEIKVSYEGRVKKMIREYYAIVGDILMTSLLCVAMVALLVLFYYRKIRMGILMIINVAQGTLAALTFAYFIIGYLTSQTAFLGSIIVGNGINYSLIFMARYIEEKRLRNASVLDALHTSMAKTWKPTFIAALITSAAFVALILTKVRGINQFGIIGGMGMILCWISTYTVLPAWLSMFERVWETKVVMHKDSTLMGKLADFIVARPMTILKASAAVTIASFVIMAWYLPNSLEYDFSKLSFKPQKIKDSWEEYARGKMDNEIFTGGSTSPSVVVLDSMEQGVEFCDAIMHKDPESRYIENCKTIFTYVPEDQPEKLEVLADMRKLTESSTLKFLNEEQMEEVNKFKESVDLQAITVDDIPRAIVQMFEDIDENRGRLAYVYPKANLWDGKELSIFASMLRETTLSDGSVIRASGQPVILSDLLAAVVEEGPRITLISFLLVLVLIWASFIRFKYVSAIQISVLTGVVWLIGLMGLVSIKLNFLNFVALPITFGIGVDYAVNVYQRYRQEGVGSVRNVVAHLGGAVALCSATTIIGYSVLLISRSRALVSFGIVALLGEITCLAASLVSLPAFIIWREKRAEAKKIEETLKNISGDNTLCSDIGKITLND